MPDKKSARFWVEAIFGSLAGLLGLLTLIWRDWIEAVFDVNPDHHNGSLEWVIVAGLLLVAVVLGLQARAEYRRLAVARRAPPVG